MKIKKGDFIQINYTGTVGGQIFDTTDQKVAKESNLMNPDVKYNPIIVCVGQNHLLKGLDTALVDKEVGQEFKVTLQPDDAFGKKDAQLIQMVPKAKFSKDKINPQPGMQLNIDGAAAIVRQVSGGRVMVDFNHPLSGREVEYELKILKKIEDKSEQLKSVAHMELGIPENLYTVNVKEDVATLEFEESIKSMLEPVVEKLKEKINEAIQFKDVKITFKSAKLGNVKEKAHQEAKSEAKEEKK
jgi:FKBP-type peptidyl-prolyl cis-trans isomerase 2